MDLNEVRLAIYQLLIEGKQMMCDAVENNKEDIETVRDVLGVIGDAATTTKIIQTVITLPDQLYMRKYRRFEKGVGEYDLPERQKIMRNVSELKVKTYTPFILNVINACEEEEKMDFLVKLTAAWMEERLDDADYRRLALMMERTPYDDMIYLKGLLKNSIELRSVMDESLFANGWLNADSVALQKIHRDAVTQCHLTANAWKFGEVVFGIKSPKGTNPFRPSIVLEVQETQE